MTETAKEPGMPKTEAHRRAQRVASLFFQPGSDLYKELAKVIGKEIWETSVECGWQKEEVVKLTELLKESGHYASSNRKCGE